MNFNIHDLLYLKISGGNRRYLDYLRKEYSFFETEEKINPDIEVVITDSIHDDTDSRLINNRYFIRDGHLHSRDRYKVVRWSFSIDDLEGRPTVHFSGGIWGEHILKDFIIEPLIGFKLATKGFSILHASAIAINDAGFLFTGGPGSGKTASLLSLNNDNNVFLSDEITLLSSEGVIYSFPLPIRIYYHNLKAKTLASGKITARQKLEAILKHYLYLLSLGYVKFALSIDADKLFERTGGIYPLHRLFSLTRTMDKAINVTEISDKKALVERLALVNERQFPRWGKYVSAYSSVFPSSQLATYPRLMRAHLSSALDKVTCYEIKAPYRFEARHRDKFRQIIQTLGKGN
ncbi:hypothetical protein ACFLU1_06695 [Chloroflexota bacterium]